MHFQYYLKYFQNVIKPYTNCYGLTTGCRARKLYFSALGCLKPKEVGETLV